jgi:DNA polymerase-3 subunit alpha
MYPRRVYVEAIKRAGIDLRLPCINRSAADFVIEGEGIRTGLEAVASLDEALWNLLLADRQRRGLFRDMTDFRRRVNPGPEALALLIRSGALDFTGRPRPALFLEADLHNPLRQAEARLFNDDSDLGWSPDDYAQDRRLRDEWEILGFVVGQPMLALFRPQLPGAPNTSRDLASHVGRPIQVAGLVATARHTPTVDGRAMQFVTLEDEWGLIEVTLFPGTCPPVAYLTLGPYLASGIVEDQYGVLTLTARRFQKLKLSPANV